MKTGNRRGSTLIEMVFAASILAVIIGVPLRVGKSTNQAFGTGMAVAELDTRARNALNRIGERLASSSLDMITDTEAPFSSTRLEFGGLDFVGGAVVPGPMEVIEFRYDPGELDDGLDNDGDGLIDEGRVVWVVNGVVVLLTDSVRETAEGEIAGNVADDNGNGLIDERGLAFSIDGERVTVHLTLERFDSQGHLVTNSVSRTITFTDGGL